MLLLVKHLRCQRRLTQQQLAERSGCSRELISSIENQRVTPTLTRLADIAQALDVSVAELLQPRRGRPAPPEPRP